MLVTVVTITENTLVYDQLNLACIGDADSLNGTFLGF